MRRRTSLVALLVVASTLALPAVASPQPQNVCGVCGQTFRYAADQHDVELSIERSELRIRVDEDGTGHWTARVSVDDAAADRFRDDSDLLDSVVQEALSSYGSVPEDPRDVSAGMDGDAVVVTFTVPEMAHRGVDGVLLVDYFHGKGYERHLVLDADRLEIRGPEGTVLANGPPDATREDGAAVWTKDGGRAWLDDEIYVAFGPDQSLRTLAAAQVAVAADAAPFLVEHLLAAAFLPTIVLAVGLAGVRGLLPIGRLSGSSERAGYAVAAVAIAWVGLLAYHGHSFSGLGALGWLLGVQFAVLGAIVASGSMQLTYRRTLAVAVAAPAVGAVVGAQLTGHQSVLVGLGLALPFALFLPLGYAVRREQSVHLLAIAILAAPVLIAGPMIPIGGFGPGFASLMLAGWALVTVAAGAILYHLGWALGGDQVDSGAGSASTENRRDEV